MRSNLQKREILRGCHSFANVLSEGKSVQAGPIRCFFLVVKGEEKSIRVGFSVSRAIGKASTRNYLRRLMREGYRKNKQLLSEKSLSGGSTKMVFMYARRSPIPQKRHYGEVEQSIITLLSELNHRS